MQDWPFPITVAKTCYKAVKIGSLFRPSPLPLGAASCFRVAFCLLSRYCSSPESSLFMSIAPERTRTAFVKLERDLRKLALERQPESVHSFRTGSRRLQTLLENIFPNRDRNQRKLLKLLTRIRKRAGKVRDIDVQ